MSVTDELLRNNEKYSKSFTKGDLPLPPAKHVAVLACMDARLDVHNILGLDAYGTLGPDLTHFRRRPTLAAGQLLNTRGNLAGWIADAPAIKPGTLMPPNQLSGAEMSDLLAYLETLR